MSNYMQVFFFSQNENQEFALWQKWANQFPEFNATPAEEIYVILYMLSLFQNNKLYPVIRMSYYAIKYFNQFFAGGTELGSHFILLLRF